MISREKCFELMEEYKVPPNVRSHNILVNKVAVFLAKKLEEKGIEIDIELVDRASLLHDLMKAIEFSDYRFQEREGQATKEQIEFWESLKERFKGKRHDEAAFEVLKDIDPRVAEVVLKHNLTFLVLPEAKDMNWEEKIVNYADKRAISYGYVTVKERFEEWGRRHPEYAKLKTTHEKLETLYDLEKEIFDILGIDPDKLEQEMKKEEKLEVKER